MENLFSSTMIDDNMWYHRLQYQGHKNKDSMPQNTYKKSQIPLFSPKEGQRFYYELTTISISLVKSFTSEHELGHRWDGLPKIRRIQN